MTRFRVATFDLGRVDADPADLLEFWLAADQVDQGFVIEKDDGDGAVSFLGVSPSQTLRVIGGKAYSQTGGYRRLLPGNPFTALGRKLSKLKVWGRPMPFSNGVVGSLSYEMTRYLERVPMKTEREQACLMFYPNIVMIDRKRRHAQLFSLLPAPKAQALARRLLALTKRDTYKRYVSPMRPMRSLTFSGRLGRPAFLRGVRKLKEHIRAGDIFQGVLSEQFTARISAPPLSVYRLLRAQGASPYFFYLRDGARHLLGASPERLVKVVDGQALNCPIAGTRPRGGTRAADLRNERRLKASAKERAEHLMLVDLARNDLGRVCTPGTVRVKELMRVHRYPNVMHLVSQIEGRLERGVTAWDALAASFPAGTVSGAPKVRAMQLLSELEPVARGFYAGAILQHDLRGNLDSCIAIRSALIENGRVRFQAGAGIVADSNPGAEYQEALDKLSSLRRAIIAAEAAA